MSESHRASRFLPRLYVAKHGIGDAMWRFDPLAEHNEVSYDAGYSWWEASFQGDLSAVDNGLKPLHLTDTVWVARRHYDVYYRYSRSSEGFWEFEENDGLGWKLVSSEVSLYDILDQEGNHFIPERKNCAPVVFEATVVSTNAFEATAVSTNANEREEPPVGAIVRDKDGDVWVRVENGRPKRHWSCTTFSRDTWNCDKYVTWSKLLGSGDGSHLIVVWQPNA